MAKQGKLDEARAYLQALPDDRRAARAAAARRGADCCATPTATGTPSTCSGKALEEQPEQPELLYDHAMTAEKLERFDVLESNLRKLIQVKPDHAHAYNALGYSFADRNMRLPEARKLIEKALELAPDDPFIIDSMGWVLYRMGDLKGAEQWLRRAYNGRPDPEIGAHLGEVLWVMGERAEAERVWNESLEGQPRQRDAAKDREAAAPLTRRGAPPERRASCAPLPSARPLPLPAARSSARARLASRWSSSSPRASPRATATTRPQRPARWRHDARQRRDADQLAVRAGRRAHHRDARRSPRWSRRTRSAIPPRIPRR